MSREQNIGQSEHGAKRFQYYLFHNGFGDTTSEFPFAFHQVLPGLAPRLSLDTVLRSSNQIAAALSEPRRKRRPQIDSLS